MEKTSSRMHRETNKDVLGMVAKNRRFMKMIKNRRRKVIGYTKRRPEGMIREGKRKTEWPSNSFI